MPAPVSTPENGFDLLAPHYRWMEFILAGDKLQRCRTAFLPTILPPQNVLILGEGTGRFLGELLGKHSNLHVTCVDSSQQMLNQASRRTQHLHSHHQSVRFIRSDILDWQSSGENFDLIATHFFLDCFRPEQIERIVKRLGEITTSDARWLLSDFQEPAHGWQKIRAKLILASMYHFFRLATKLPAHRLVEPDIYLREQGFTLANRQISEWGLLHTDLWEKRGKPERIAIPSRQAASLY